MMNNETNMNENPISADFIGKYCIIRTNTAGVFAGTLGRMSGKQALVHNARRLWYWSGAASLSQLAAQGTKNPDECKFPLAIATILVTDVIEILQCTDAAQKSIMAVPEWSK